MRRSLPKLILLLLLVDAALLGLYIGVGAVFELSSFEPNPVKDKIHALVDIEAEGNLATWFSAVQLLLVAGLLGLHAHRHRLGGASRAVWLPAFVLLLLSLDEVAMLHEWVGYRLDVLLPDGSRAGSPFHYTGLWGIVLGVPAALLLCWMWIGLRSFLSEAPTALRKLVLGSLLLVGGAAGFDFLANWTIGNQWLHGIEVVLEEGLEMVGGTIMCWAALELVVAGAYRVSFVPWRPREEAQDVMMPRRIIAQRTPITCDSCGEPVGVERLN